MLKFVGFIMLMDHMKLYDGDWAAVIGKLEETSYEMGKPITIVGDGKQRRDFTHIDDIVEALYKIGMR